MNYAQLKKQTIGLLNDIRCILYPDVFDADAAVHDLDETKDRIRANFLECLCFLGYEGECSSVVDKVFTELPHIKELLETDVQAAYEGDPAAKCKEEIMVAYPAFEAISTFRIAHVLYELKVPLMPRIMTENAHSKTGIDIHPGATVGPYFFIDHGTGVVIGETTKIGEYVKLYQGVTLGAKSFEVNLDGTLVKGNKRHPNIGNHVIIYAGATILGGETTIGDHCVIGGNVWLTHSVEPGTTIVAALEQVNKTKPTSFRP